MKDQTEEHARLREAREDHVPWRKWGPYLSERQWGTVREDYSANGDAWNYFSHDQARSRAYRWGEDGLAGICNEDMTLCFALALWNGRDPILKERLFGLTNSEGNHGEDVKEYYFYLDSTPTHSYMKMLYKYPQAAFPYMQLIEGGRQRSRTDPEFELLDTGIFNEDRYHDVFVEYAKASPEDILVRISIINRGPDPATLHVLPHLWFRNTGWADSGEPVPVLSERGPAKGDISVIAATHWELGQRYLFCEGAKKLLFTNNETNTQRLFGSANRTPYVKDGIDNCIVHGQRSAVNPEGLGTKAAAHYELTIAPQKKHVIRLRFTDKNISACPSLFGRAFDRLFAERRTEANHFFSALAPEAADGNLRQVMRQGMAGMMWSKQTYVYEASRWLHEHSNLPTRNAAWRHLYTRDVISMPDKWEYPWFAAWDLAFQTVALAFMDPDFALQQIELLLRERYLHPNGQIPAYEWNFGDVNPPVHAWASLFIYRISKDAMGERALGVLKSGFHKLLLNFTWWVNRKDRNGHNIFEGGFLGLDNIGIFDRSSPIPGGGFLEQADGTAWMALFAQNLLEISLELSLHDPVYGDLAVKFYEHFVHIASAMCRTGNNHESMWDEQDGFFYDLLRLPDGNSARLKLRSMVGLLPLCAVTVYPSEIVHQLPEFAARASWFSRNRPDLFVDINPPGRQGINGRYMLSILDERKLRRVLACMLDPGEFLSDYGLRSMSRYHLDHPYVFQVAGQEFRASYLPAESDSGMFGGNSNWRGPIWMPMNVLVIRALLQMYSYYGNEFKVECPTGSGNKMTLFEVAQELTARLSKLFLTDKSGRRPHHGNAAKFQNDPNWSDLLLFYEYFHGDSGAGLGASHQTGWTGLIAGLIRLFGTVTADDLLKHGSMAAVNIMKPTRGRSERKDDVHATVLHDPVAQPMEETAYDSEDKDSSFPC
jgi:hypothetical protein